MVVVCGMTNYKALYAFSGDPITFGHVDIIKRGSIAFGNLIVAIGDNPAKKYLFSKTERIDMATEVLKDCVNIKVVSFEGLLTDFACEQKITTIIRGIRSAADFDYESLLFQLGKTQKNGVDFHFLLASAELNHVSSGAVKALQLEQGDITGYVPLHVKVALERKISGQIFLGITGEIAVGKSFVADLIKQQISERGISCHHIDLDQLAHEILEEDNEPMYQHARQKLVDIFGCNILSPTGYIDRKKLGKIIFGSPGYLNQVNEILKEPMELKFKRSVYKKRGLILVNSALIPDARWLPYCNNRVILVNASDDIRHHRLQKRGWNEEEVQQRINAQYNHDVKRSLILDSIAKAKFGKLWEFSNSAVQIDQSFNELLNQIISELTLEEQNNGEILVA
jgi:pantetheine-phosphate adenylyltransferase